MMDIEEMMRMKCAPYLEEDELRENELHEDEEELCCQECHVHEDIVTQVRKVVPEDDKLREVADLYKKFSDFTRVKIMYMLSVSEMCVCDLSDLLGMSQPAISNHLRVLKQANLVKNRRQGKMIYYSLADSHVETILSQGLEHVEEKKTL